MPKLNNIQKEIISYLISIYPQKAPFYHIEDKFRNENITQIIMELINDGYIHISNEKVTMLYVSEKGKNINIF